MNKIAYTLLILLLTIINISNTNAQITLQCVKPGEEVLVQPDGDTLWIINDARMRSVVETGRLYRISKEKVAILTQKCDTLSAISAEKDSLINILKNDRDYYAVELKDSRQDVVKAGEMARKYKRRAKLATIGIGVGAAVGLAVGYLLFND